MRRIGPAWARPVTQRIVAAPDSSGMREAQEDLRRRNELGGMFGVAPQTLGARRAKIDSSAMVAAPADSARVSPRRKRDTFLGRLGWPFQR